MEDKKIDTNQPIIGIIYDKETDIAQWYTDVVVKAEMIEYYDVSGCYILKPWSYSIWESIQNDLNQAFKLYDIKNAYFPIFVTKEKLEAEKSHIDGFSAEVAWITKSGNSDLAKPIAIRPTSETIIYPAFSKWIRSHRDLPLKINQWSSVVRWEFSQPTPFIRTREFLWHEGHTAHASKEEATNFAVSMLHEYEKLYRDKLAIHVVMGKKSTFERFAGADTTYTVEAFIHENGRAIQAGTSHHLGDNFAKIFDLTYESKSKERCHVYQTSFGLSTRSIGAIVLVHGDNKGLVLPPRIAEIQVIIIPIYIKKDDEKITLEVCEDMLIKIKQKGYRVDIDDRIGYKPGYKFNHWEMRGVPIRLEIGPSDIENNTCRCVTRCNGKKIDYKRADFIDKLDEIFNTAHDEMYQKSKTTFLNNIKKVNTLSECLDHFENKFLVQVPWCYEESCEIKTREKINNLISERNKVSYSGFKTICTPLEQEKLEPNQKCFSCDQDARCFTLWGRSY